MKSEFLSKHYEKIILAAALIFFIFSLTWLINVFDDISTRASKDIVIHANKNPYQSVDKNYYNSDTSLQGTKTWLNSKKRNTNANDPDYIITFTDFMLPFEIARSKALGAKNKLIPYAYYKKGICPISKGPISLKKTVVDQTDVLDTDQDGIPDAMEKQYNMDPKDAEDIYGDIDNDGFSNIDEYLYNKKGVTDSSIHPHFINRLLLVKVSDTRIPLILKKIVRHGDNKKNWYVQLNLKDADHKWITKFLKIGDSIKVNDIKYTVKDIQKETSNVLDPRLGTVVEKDISKVVLHNSLNEKINAQKDQQIYEPNRKITLKNLYTGKTIYARLNNVITLGDKTSKQEKYKIIAIGNNDNSIEFERNGEKFTVTKENSYKPPSKPAIMPSEPISNPKK